MRMHIAATMAATALACSYTAATAAGPSLTDAQADAVFAKADPDNDGTVSKLEAGRFGITVKNFNAANPDKDGTLDKKEFAAAVTRQFVAADADKDGTLDRREARKAGIKSKRIFETADPDKGGTLDLPEYLSALAAQVDRSQ